MTRKTRTRAHVIEDLSINHVERFAFQCGFSTERVSHDYGTDLLVFTYSGNGELENGQVFVQLKATDHIEFNRHETEVLLSIEKAHLESWLEEPFPVILIVYNARGDAAYWLYVQRYYETMQGFNLAVLGKAITVHIPVANLLDHAALVRFAAFKEHILSQVRGVISHA